LTNADFITRPFCAVVALILVAGMSAGQAAPSPLVDYHQHLFSPAASALVTGDPNSPGIFGAANGYRMAIVVHMRTSIDNRRKYGADEARVFLDELLPAAPDVPIQIAHLAGAGGYDTAIDAALGVLADAMAAHDARMKNVWFDANLVRSGMSADDLQRIAARIRQIGVERVLYGSDAAMTPQNYPRAVWEQFRKIPLTETERRAIAGNVTPYMRDLVAR
jgi:predicted TIM-barrel fold metal-dependent hydrolase